MAEKKKKKLDKGLVTAICVCVGIALLVVGIVVLPEPIIGAVELSQSKKFVENATDIRVVLNSPMQSGGILSDAEYVMEDEVAEKFTERVGDMLKNIKYSRTEKSDTGIWKTKIVIYSTTEELRIYVDPEALYLEKNGNLIKYRIPDSLKAEYDALYFDINEMLSVN